MIGNGWRRAVLAGCVSGALSVLTFAAARPAHASSFEACVAKETDKGKPRAEAISTCLARSESTVAPPTTKNPGREQKRTDDEEDSGGDRSARSTDAESGGTSLGLLAGVGAGGLVVGAAGAALLLRRRAPAAARLPAAPVPTSPLPPPGGHAPGLAPPPATSPAAPAPSAAASARALVDTLIDLADRLPSEALRAEIIAALATVDVHPIVVAPGTPFDAARMRGVGSTPAPAPAAVGTVAATDRAGYRDGARVIRLPDVVVHTGT